MNNASPCGHASGHAAPGDSIPFCARHSRKLLLVARTSRDPCHANRTLKDGPYGYRKGRHSGYAVLEARSCSGKCIQKPGDAHNEQGSEVSETSKEEGVAARGEEEGSRSSNFDTLAYATGWVPPTDTGFKTRANEVQHISPGAADFSIVHP